MILPETLRLLIASALLVAYQGSLWGTFLVLTVMSYLARCLEATWPEAAQAHTARLLARARKALQRGSLNRVLRLARIAEALARTAKAHAQAVELQGQSLVQQGCGTAALRELSRASSLDVPSPSLRVRAHLLTGESSIALALALRMFARAPKPDTARLVALALLQLQRPEEARHFASMAGESEASPVPVTPLTDQAGPAPRAWEIPLPLGLGVSWMLATTLATLLGTLAVELPFFLWKWEAVQGPYGHAITFAAGALRGGFLGLAQAWVLRRVVPEPGRWPLLTALGYGLGTVTLRLLVEFSVPPDSYLPLATILLLSVQGLMATCFQVLALGRWFKGTAVWFLALLGAAPLAELAALVLAGFIWHPTSLFAWDIPPFTLGEVAGQGLLRALTGGLILGGVGGALLHRDWARRQELYPRPPPRPLTASYPHVLARTRPAVVDQNTIPQELSLALMSGNLFCPGADAFFFLPEAEHTRLSEALSHFTLVIAPKQEGLAPGRGEVPPQVGILAQVYSAMRIWRREQYRMTVRMLARVRIREFVPSEHGPRARLEPIEDFPSAQPQAQLDRLRYRLNDYIRSTPGLELEAALSLLELSMEERRTLLEDLNPDSRIARVCAWLDRALLEPLRPIEAPLAHVMPISFRTAWGE